MEYSRRRYSYCIIEIKGLFYGAGKETYMKIKHLYQVMMIEDYSNTHINGERKALFMYAKEHPDETVKSIYIRDNGVVEIKTKIKTN